MSELLPGEGERRVQIRRRRDCDWCGEPATKRVTFLLKNARGNPASSAYRHDDCSWCSDAEAFSCDECQREAERKAPDGMSWCATFSAAERYPHMLLYWDEAVTP